MIHENVIITRLLTVASLCLVVSACEGEPDEELEAEPSELRALSQTELVARANAIKAAHAAHPYIDNPVLFAGIANAETGMAHCYDEYTGQKCLGQYTTPDCGGGAILAGGWDGSCDQGGLGMFQFDNGTQAQTVNYWATQGMWPPGAQATRDVVDLEGNVQASIDFVLFKAWYSSFTPYFASYQDMYDWVNSIEPIDGDPDFEQWLGFLAYNYNGWSPYTTGWYNAKNKYRNATLGIYSQLGGYDFWYGGGGGQQPPQSCSPEGGLWCGGNGVSGDPNTLYTCKNGALVVKEVCAAGCYNAAQGNPDSCNQPNSADLDCSCASGKYHNGDPIAVEDTYCGMRVCGMDGNVYECTTSDAWEDTGLNCGSGDCSCAGGSHLDGTPIAQQHTECHFQVCGGGNTWYTCEPGGWQAVSGSYCTMGGGGGPVDDPNSCVGHCGGSAGNCWCDEACENYGDCCADKAAACGGGGTSCGDLAAQQGWDWASCEWNGNGACGGQGTATSDCDHCCGGVYDDDGFGYPVGDKTSYPAGGWTIWQYLSNYWANYGGRHLAQDISHASGGVYAIDAPVYSVANGVVRYAGTNTTSYKNVVLIEHDDGQGGKVCSFYAHVHNLAVSTGQTVSRGQKIAEVLDWAVASPGGYSSNTHLHYVLLNKSLCDASANAGGSLVCGYDTGGWNSVDSLAAEPFSYQAISDPCGASGHGQAFISPAQFIDANHF